MRLISTIILAMIVLITCANILLSDRVTANALGLTKDEPIVIVSYGDLNDELRFVNSITYYAFYKMGYEVIHSADRGVMVFIGDDIVKNGRLDLNKFSVPSHIETNLKQVSLGGGACQFQYGADHFLLVANTGERDEIRMCVTASLLTFFGKTFDVELSPLENLERL